MIRIHIFGTAIDRFSTLQEKISHKGQLNPPPNKNDCEEYFFKPGEYYYRTKD